MSVSEHVSESLAVRVVGGSATWAEAVSTAAFGSLAGAPPHQARAFDDFVAAHLTADDRAELSATTGVRFGLDGAPCTAQVPAGDAQPARDVVAAVALQRADGDTTPLRPGAVTALLVQARRACAAAAELG